MDAPLPPPDPTTRSDGPPPPRRPRADRARWVVPLAVVAALALALVVGRSLLSTGDGDDGRGTWNGLAVIDVTDGSVRILDRDGTEIRTIDTDVGASRAWPVDEHTIVVDGDRESAVVDVATGETRSIRRPDGTDLLPIDGAVVFGDFAGGTAYALGDDGELHDLGAAAGWDDPVLMPHTIRAWPERRLIVASDLGGSDETLLWSTEDGEGVTVPGFSADVDESGIITWTRNDDDQTVIEHFDLDGDSTGAVVGPRSLAAAIPGPSAGTLIGVTFGGSVMRLSTEDGSAREVAQIDVEGEIDMTTRSAGGAPVLGVVSPFDGVERLVIVGPDGRLSEPVELGADGAILGLGTGDDPCALVRMDGEMALVTMGDGEVRQRIETDAVRPPEGSADRCTVVDFTSRTSLLTRDRVIEPPEGLTFEAVSPDGAWAILAGRDRRLAVPIEQIGDDGTIPDGTGIELRGSELVAFVDRG